MNPSRGEIFERLSQTKSPKIRERNTIGGIQTSFFKKNRITQELANKLKEKLFFPKEKIKVKKRHKTFMYRPKNRKTLNMNFPNINFKVGKVVKEKNTPSHVQNRTKEKETECEEMSNIKEPVPANIPESSNKPQIESKVEKSKNGSFSTVHINIINKETPRSSMMGPSRQPSSSILQSEVLLSPSQIKRNKSIGLFKSKKLSATLVFTANGMKNENSNTSKILENLFQNKNQANLNRCSILKKESYNYLMQKPKKEMVKSKKKYKVHRNT
jgi:hypothetical protein